MKDRQALLCKDPGLGECLTGRVWVQKRFLYCFLFLKISNSQSLDFCL